MHVHVCYTNTLSRSLVRGVIHIDFQGTRLARNNVYNIVLLC